MESISRRTYLQQMAGLAMLPFIPSWLMQSKHILTRPVPGTAEQLPVIGLGTWQTFDVGEAQAEREPLKEVLKVLFDHGGSVIDSSPMYGRSEKVVGELSTEVKLNEKFFMATKVWTNGKDNGIRQMNESFTLLKRKHIELMQIHNLVDWQTHLKTLRDWKAQGKIKYIGITHYTESAYASLEQILKTEAIDFLQINYSLLSRKAEERLFPLCMEKQVAVLVNQPFESGNLFNRMRGKDLPAWAKDFDCASWGQFFLKFILSHPAVTCVIPGTSKPHHMLDNLGAGFGKLPDEQQRQEMIKLIA
ncbi:MAG TPA: aldo/keto reductase [Cyclobacteriaceae bacterium]|nr:aldo/keto reductase [Cyclobacteriaceae bacterium]